MMNTKFETRITEDVSLKFVKLLNRIFSSNKKPVELHEPLFDGMEHQYIKECLDSSYVSSIGKYVNKFENLISQYTKSPYSVAVVNGTVAIQVGLYLLGVKPNDEVLVPSLSFVATANAVVHCGAIPHFLDVDKETLGINTNCLEDYLNEIAFIKNKYLFNKKTGRRISVIIPMHTYGHAVRIDEILAIAKKFKLNVLEDAAEALGSFYKKKHLGTFGDVGVLSFNGNKIITTGGGGAILTNNVKIFKLAKHLTSTAKKNHIWDFYHDQVGWNYRMPNLNAALGCAQMESLEKILRNKRKLTLKYRKYFDKVNDFELFREPDYCVSNYWLNIILLKKPNLILRNTILSKAIENGFKCRPVWTLLTKLPMYKKNPSMNIKIAKQLEKQIICLPSSSHLIK